MLALTRITVRSLVNSPFDLPLERYMAMFALVRTLTLVHNHMRSQALVHLKRCPAHGTLVRSFRVQLDVDSESENCSGPKLAIEAIIRTVDAVHSFVMS